MAALLPETFIASESPPMVDIKATASKAPPDDRAQRLAEAERFLSILDPEAESLCFQTFDDTPEKRGHLAQTIVGDLNSVWSRLEKLNQQGAGVFVTINETRGHTRKTEDVIRVRAVFADFDPPKTAPAPPSSEYPLPPVMVVESSPGKHHVYWTVAGLDLDQFTQTQKAIIARFGSDPVPNDLPRVMRLPGIFSLQDQRAASCARDRHR